MKKILFAVIFLFLSPVMLLDAVTKELIMITGSSSGIGKATAEVFSKEGYPLLLISRRGNLSERELPNVRVRPAIMQSFLLK